MATRMVAAHWPASGIQKLVSNNPYQIYGDLVVAKRCCLDLENLAIEVFAGTLRAAVELQMLLWR